MNEELETDLDPEIIAFGERQGDIAPLPPISELPNPAKAVLADLALMRLNKLPQGEYAGRVASPFEVIDPPWAEEELVQEGYILDKIPLDLIRSVIVDADYDEVRELILSGKTTPLPLVVDTPDGQILYRGLAMAIARGLMGDAELVVEAVLP